MGQMDKHSASENGNSRRRFIKGTSAAVVVTSLTSKSVFAQAVDPAGCTPSGFQSVNPSGVERHSGACNGFSHGGWATPYSGNGDGSIEQWDLAGDIYHTMTGGSVFATAFVPEKPAQAGISSSQQLSRANARFDRCFGYNAHNANSSCTSTKWADVFGNVGPLSSMSLHKVLMQGGAYSLERDAVAAFLSACYLRYRDGMSVNFIDPRDVVNLYAAAQSNPAGGQNVTLFNGNVIKAPSKSQLGAFFLGLQHSNNA